MTQLSFQPALDPLHAVFRILRLRSIIASRGPMETDHVRILDFYLLFPFRIKAIRFKREDKAVRKLTPSFDSLTPYVNPPEDRVLFRRMLPMQGAALQTLASRSLISADYLSDGRVTVTDVPPPPGLAQRLNEANMRDEGVLNILNLLASYELHGPDGLKARTGLLEYRYDAV